MVRIRSALIVAALLFAGWLVWQGYAAGWERPALYERLGRTAFDWRLAGLGAACYARAGDLRAQKLARSADAASDRGRSALLHDRMVTARILESARRPCAAATVAERAYEEDPSNPAAGALRWRLRYRCGDEAAARRELRLLSDRTGSPEALVALAACLADEGANKAARKLLERALEKDTRLSEGWLHLARVFRSQHNRPDTFRAAMKAWQSSADQPVIRHTAAAMILQMGSGQGLTIGGCGIDSCRRVVIYWMHRHWTFLLAAGLYLLFVFWPAISAGLKSPERDAAG